MIRRSALNHLLAALFACFIAGPVLWMPLVTNMFDGDGNFSYTNMVDSGTPKLFLRLAQ